MGKKKRVFTRARRRPRKLKHDGVSPQLLEALKMRTGEPPTVEDAYALQLEMTEEVLTRMVQLRIAQWLETVMIILRDGFGFNEQQLATFVRLFMEKTREQTETTPFPDDGR